MIENRTKLYLANMIRVLDGDDIVLFMNEHLGLIEGFFIGVQTYHEEAKALFVVYSPNNEFNSILNKYRKFIGYLADYDYNEYHVIVFRLPSKYNNAIHYFLNGEYSKLYDPEDIEKLFTSNIKGILKKDPVYRKRLEEFLDVTINDNAELDDKPKKIDEIYDYQPALDEHILTKVESTGSTS